MLDLTRMQIFHFFTALFVCLSLGAFICAYIGPMGHDALTGQQENPLRSNIIALALLVTLVCLTRSIRRAYKPELSDEHPNSDTRGSDNSMPINGR